VCISSRLTSLATGTRGISQAVPYNKRRSTDPARRGVLEYQLEIMQARDRRDNKDLHARL